MLLFFKILLIAALFLITFQDFKERKVWVFLFPVFALLGSYFFFNSSELEFYITSIGINILVILLVLMINYFFARIVLKKRLINEAMGLGDILFFVGFAISFPTITFLNFFVFSILFTFVFHLVVKRISSSWHKDAPLAGCMSLFLLAVYLIYWTGFYDPIYIL